MILPREIHGNHKFCKMDCGKEEVKVFKQLKSEYDLFGVSLMDYKMYPFSALSISRILYVTEKYPEYLFKRLHNGHLKVWCNYMPTCPFLLDFVECDRGKTI